MPSIYGNRKSYAVTEDQYLWLKNRERMSATPKMIECSEKHRELKSHLITLMGKVASPNITKERIKDELFKFYMELK